MKNKYFNEVAPPSGLCEKIMRRINREEVRQVVRRRLFVWIALTVLTLVALVPAFIFFRSEASATGLGQYVAIIGLSPGVALAHWSDLLSSLSESIPVVSLTILAGVFALALWAVDESIRFGRRLYQI